MKQFLKLVIISLTAGSILAAVMTIIYRLTGNQAYILLYNMDYIPILQKWEINSILGIAFHFVTCIVSVLLMFYSLSWFHLDPRASFPYIFVYTVGGGILFSLTALTAKPPDLFDLTAWLYWTAGHALFGLTVGGFVKRWVH